jgi:hypothetical protein
MEYHRGPKRALYSTPGGVRRRAKPRRRWLDDVEDGIRSAGLNVGE